EIGPARVQPRQVGGRQAVQLAPVRPTLVSAQQWAEVIQQVAPGLVGRGVQRDRATVAPMKGAEPGAVLTHITKLQREVHLVALLQPLHHLPQAGDPALAWHVPLGFVETGGPHR
ncbi:hypothetical protein RZS08_00865, partial [Arthrospira platensis SPKY1]|nr:hypothetical protein [Arthrospira platensis SPKY1]